MVIKRSLVSANIQLHRCVTKAGGLPSFLSVCVSEEPIATVRICCENY